MTVDRINIFNINFSDFNSNEKDLKSIDPSLVRRMLNFGLSKDAITRRLLSENNTDKLSFDELENYKNEINILIEAQEQALKEENGTYGNDILLTQQSPIGLNSDDWQIDNFDELFVEDITKENFEQEYESMTSELDNTEMSDYLLGIQAIGADNFFNAIDENQDGILALEELQLILNVDSEGTTMSAQQFNDIFDEARNLLNMESQEIVDEILNENIQNESQEVLNVNPQNKDNKVKKQKSNNYSNNSVNRGGKAETKKEETLDDLLAKRKQIETDADNKIEELNKNYQTLIDSVPDDNLLKQNYQNAQNEFNAHKDLLSQNQTLIDGLNNSIHTNQVNLLSAKGELENLKIDTGDTEIDSKNLARKQELEKIIEKLELEKIKLDNDLIEAENEKIELDKLTLGLENNVKATFEAFSASLNSDIKTQLAEIQTQIQSVEAKKTADLQEIDKKIETKKAQELNNAYKNGESKGKLASNKVGASIVETALKYLGYNEKDGSYKIFSTGDYGWCADFVTYVMKEVCKDGGMNKSAIKEVSKHLGASPYKLRTRNKEHYYNTRNMSDSEYQEFISTKLQPGMAFISKGSGASGEHTGFVAEVNWEKGTFVTIEGNSSNKVRQQERKISDMYGFVDLSYLYSA